MKRLGLIGSGGMAGVVLSALAEQLSAPLETLSILTSRGGREDAERRICGSPRLASVAGEVRFRTDLESFLADRVELVAECAGHAAVGAYGDIVLRSGVDLVLASTGALASDELRAALLAAARAGNAKLVLASGAIGGIDILAAARLSGLKSVAYVGRKPPGAWAGTAAEHAIDLADVRAPTIFFEGPARRAAREYPQNANVAATVALAGLGFDATHVRLVADPGVSRNVHEVRVESGCANFSIVIEGVPSPDNPKTSLTAGYSLARTILGRVSELVVGG